MNRATFLILWAIICLVGACDRSAPAPPATRPAADVLEIAVITPTAWWLRVAPDGSARYGHGAENGQSATVPAATFDIDEVLATLQPLSEQGDMFEHVGVVVRRSGDAAVKSQYTPASESVRHLFERARRSTPNPALDEIRDRTPPIETEENPDLPRRLSTRPADAR